MVKVALGHDSHRFEPEGSSKPLVLAGVRIEGCTGLAANSDGDVVLHAVANAISGLTGVNILGPVADEMCLKQGITDSAAYVRKALEFLLDFRIAHVSISVEAKRPVLGPHIPAMRRALSALLSLSEDAVGFTVTSGEGLSAFGRGEGIQAFAAVTAVHAAQHRSLER